MDRYTGLDNYCMMEWHGMRPLRSNHRHANSGSGLVYSRLENSDLDILGNSLNYNLYFQNFRVAA